MGITTLILIALSIIVYLAAILIAARIPMTLRLDRRSPWIIVILILGITLLQRILAFVAAYREVAAGTTATTTGDLIGEITIALFPLALLWGLGQVENLLARRRQVTKEATQRTVQLELINRLSSLISSAAGLEEVLQILVDELTLALRVDLCVLVLLDKSGEWAEVAAANLPPSMLLPLGDQIPVPDNPIVQEVLHTRGSVVVNNAATDPRLALIREIMDLQGTQSLLIVPLLYRDQAIGAVALGSVAKTRIHTAEEIELTQTVANQAAVAIEQARLLETEQERRQMAEALSQVAATLTSTLDLNRVLELVLKGLREIIVYDSSAIFLREGDQLLLTASQGFPESAQISDFSFNIKDSALRPVLTEEGQPMVISDVREAEQFRTAAGTEYIRSWIGAPLWARGKLVGLLSVDHSQPRVYDEKDAQRVMNFANQAAIVIENARLFEEQMVLAEELEARNEELIETQQKLIEAERLAVIGQVGLTMRHEINNPLTTVMGLAQWILSEHPELPGGILEDLRTIEKMAVRIRDTVNKLEEAKYRTITYMGDATMLDLHGQDDEETSA